MKKLRGSNGAAAFFGAWLRLRAFLLKGDKKMYCRKCGSEIPDDSAFCVKCGTPVERAAEKTQKTEPVIKCEEKSAVYTAPVKKKKRGLIITFAVIALAVVFAGLYFFVLEDANGGGLFGSPLRGEKHANILEDKEKLAEVTASVLKIECYDDEGNVFATGSGFIAFSDNIVVTNYHVIEDHPYAIKALSEDGRSFDIEGMVTYNQEMDIAILKTIGSTNLIPLSFADNEVEKTDKVVAIGSPLGLMNTVSDGIVSGFTQVGKESVIQFTASISHGSSGGVLLNESGEVVGVTFASFSEGQNLNVAIPISYVSALYSREANRTLTTVKAFYNEVDHTKTYTIEEVKTNASKHKNEEMYVCGYLIKASNYYGCYIVGDANVCEELIDRIKQSNEYILKVMSGKSTDEDQWDARINHAKLNPLLGSEVVIELDYDTSLSLKKYSNGSYVIVHGKLNSEGKIYVDSIDYFN